MRRLTDNDIEKMASAEIGWREDAGTKNSVRKSLKIRDFAGLEDISERPALIDCHGKTVDAAFGEISARIERILGRLERGRGGSSELVVITGKSGVIKQQFHTSITDGYLKNHVKSWKLVNDGCYKITIKL